MNFKSTNFEDRLLQAFYYIMFDEDCSEKRNKRFRILFFSFHFGAVTAEALPVIFFDDKALSRKNYSEAKNYSMSLLKYLAENHLLNKKSTNSYTLSVMGTSVLFKHLLEENLMYVEDEIIFTQSQRICPIHLNHASNNGITILQFTQCKRHYFETEPFISSEGKIIPSKPSLFPEKFLSPDAHLYSNDLSEDYYIETDNCEERRSQHLIPKLQKYQSSILQSTDIRCMDTTLIFSIWHKQQQSKGGVDFSIQCKEQIAFFDFFEKSFTDKITCSELLESLHQYQGNSSIIEGIRQILPNGDSTHMETYAAIKKAFKIQYALQSFDNKFIVRRDAIYSSISRVSGLKKSLLLGARFICLPLNGQNYFYKFVFIEYEKFNKYISFKLRKLHNFNCIIIYHKCKVFIDSKSGFEYVFRNVFECRLNKDVLYYIFENITEDFGGYIRVANFLNTRRVSTSEKLCLYCLYNRKTAPDPEALFNVSGRVMRSVKFLSYEESIHNNFSRDENFVGG